METLLKNRVLNFFDIIIAIIFCYWIANMKGKNDDISKK